MGLQEMRRNFYGRRLHVKHASRHAQLPGHETEGKGICRVNRSYIFFLGCFGLDNIGDFFFNLTFKIKDSRDRQVISKLLDLELKNLDDLSGRILGLSILPDGENGIVIGFHASDLTSFKIATNSINRYIEIIGKAMRLVKEEPAEENVLSNGS